MAVDVVRFLKRHTNFASETGGNSLFLTISSRIKSLHIMKKSLFTVAMMLVAISVLTGCVDKDMVKYAATYKLKNNLFRETIDTLLVLDDKTILETDTFRNMLSSAYYALNLKGKIVADDCTDMDVTPDGKTIVFSDNCNGKVSFYSYPEMKLIKTVETEVFIQGVDLSPDGKTMALAAETGRILLCDIASGKITKDFMAHRATVRSLVFKDANTLFSCGNDQVVAAWDVPSGNNLWSLHAHGKNVKNIKISGDKKKIITASNDGAACVLPATREKPQDELFRLSHCANYVNDAAFSPDGKLCATVGADAYVKFWDASDGKFQNEVYVGEALASVNFSSDGKMAIAGGANFAFLIDTQSGKIVARIRSGSTAIWSANFIGKDQFAFVNHSRVRFGKLLTVEEMLDLLRKQS